ncbi:MAG: rRNA maturation RNase YbeY [Saprospiraceae bacterium]|nr:rRNA maturation RNase YbeY [Saprospiraceae bacterium]
MKTSITFHLESEVTHPFPTQQYKIRQWLIDVATEEKKKVKSLDYIFCNDEYLLKINIKFLSHDYYTDIITFPYNELELLKGDMFISLDRVKENAAQYNISFDEELRRVMVHGLLHLIGYTDGSEAEKNEMTAKENQYLSMFKV